MVDAVETPQENQEQGKPDYSAIIRRRTGKDNLSLTSLRGIAVAELHEVGEELGLDHVDLKKADLIHSLLRMVGQDDPASKAETNTELGLGEDPDPDDDQQLEAEEGQHDAQMEEPDIEDDEEMLGDGNDEQGGTEPAEHDSRCASEQGAQMEDPDRENDAEILDDGNGEQDGTEPSCEAGAGSKGAHSPDPGQRHHFFDMSEEGVEDDANEDADEDGGDGDDTNLCSEKEATPAAQSHAKVDLSEEPEDSRQEEEEEYDEDPYLGEEPPEVQEDSDVEIEEHRDHEQDDPHPGAADGDSRHPDGEAHKSLEEDQEVVVCERTEERHSEHVVSPTEAKGRSSLSESESGKKRSEKRRTAQAPIVWQPASTRPVTLFDHHFQRLEAPAASHAEEQDFGGAVGKYEGRRLVVTITSEYAIGLRRPAKGKPKRKVQFAPGQFKVKACPELPDEKNRQPLQLASSTKASGSGKQRSAPKWNRRVTFTAQLKADEKAEYVRHGDCITVKLMNLPTNFWYSHTTARRLVIDPAEFDADYQAGVNKVEKGMSATPAHWKNSWVNQNISRLVRAKALRTFATNKAYIKPAKYYHHFSGLCKSMQKLHPPLSSDENEKAYERGCARTVGCASAVSFKMLTALPKETIGEVMTALGMHLCTPEFISGKEGVDGRLYALIKAFCPAHLFWKVVCCKGEPGSHRAKTEAAPPDMPNPSRHGRPGEVPRAVEAATDVSPGDLRARSRQRDPAVMHGDARWEREPGRRPDRDARDQDPRSAAPTTLQQRPSRWAEQATAREGGRERSRARSPVLVAQEVERARPRSGQKALGASAYADLRGGDGAGWVHGPRDAVPVPRNRKGWDNISPDRHQWPSDPPVAGRVQRGGIVDVPRWEQDSLPVQKFAELPHQSPGLRQVADRSVRHLQPMQRSGRNSQGGFVHAQANHDSMRVAMPSGGDRMLHRGLPDDRGHPGDGRKRGVHAPLRSPIPVATLRDPELGNMQGRVSVDARHMGSSMRDLEPSVQGYSSDGRMLLRKGSSDVYSHDLMPARTHQRAVIQIDDDRPPMPQRAPVPGGSRAPVHRVVQEPAPAPAPVPSAQPYDANQFQAAVAQAVQEVVKRLGVPVPGAIPDAAAAAAVQDVQAAPRAGGRKVPASDPVPDSRMLQGRQPAPYDDSPSVGRGASRGYTGRDSSYASDDFRPGSRYPDSKYGKRPRDVRSEDPVPPPRFDGNARATKARRDDLPHSRSDDLSSKQRTRYADVEIVPDVAVVSPQRAYEYNEAPGFQRDQRERPASAGRRFENDQSQRSAGRRYQNDEPQRDGGRAFQQDERPGSGRGHGATRQPPGHHSAGGAQRPPSANVGGFLNNRSGQLGDGRRGGPTGERQDPAASNARRASRATQPGSPRKEQAARPDEGGHRSSRWEHASKKDAAPDRVPEERGTKERDVHGAAPARRSAAQLPSQRLRDEPVQHSRAPMHRQAQQNPMEGHAQQSPVQQRHAQQSPVQQRHAQQSPVQQRHAQQIPMQQHAQQLDAGWQGRLGSDADNGAARAANVDRLPPVGPPDMYMRPPAGGGMSTPHDVLNNNTSGVAHVHDGMMMQAPQAAPRMGAGKSVVAPTMYEPAVAPSKPATKLRSGGSRVASSARTAEGGNMATVDNEDAFAVGSCCFAVGDGMEQVDASGVVINSGLFTNELVSAAVSIAADSINEFVHGRSGPLDSKAVLQQAVNSTQSGGAAAVMLGTLNPVTSVLSISKMGDCGFVVLRPGPSLSATGDLEVISHWMPYGARDHPGNDFSDSYYAASRHMRGQGTWARDCCTDNILLQPSDIVVAGSDGLWDAVHFFGQSGLATRQLVRSLYLGDQLDPGQLAERLLLRAWQCTQDARSNPMVEQLPPFMEEVYGRRQDQIFPVMPEDDIAVVVSYVLQA